MATTESPPTPSLLRRGVGGKPRLAYFSAEWCVGPQIALGGSDYWRLALPASKLYENGWDVVFARNLAEGDGGRIYAQDPQGRWLDDRDVIIIQRWMAAGTAEKIVRAREAGQIIINEVDDDYWRMPAGHVSLLKVDPEHNKDSNKEHYRDTISASSLITVSSQYLADELADWGPPVKLVRNFIDGSFWRASPPGDYIGWVGGLPWRGNDIEILRDTVIPWLRERQMFFYHGGSILDAPIEARLGYDRITTRPLTNVTRYPGLWQPLRVALIPIEDSSFGRAKSWAKGLEACARGIPFIHSPHAEYDRLKVGLCAREPGDWVRHLEALQDPGFYAEQRERNMTRAAELDIEHHWQPWAKVFQDAFRPK